MLSISFYRTIYKILNRIQFNQTKHTTQQKYYQSQRLPNPTTSYSPYPSFMIHHSPPIIAKFHRPILYKWVMQAQRQSNKMFLLVEGSKRYTSQVVFQYKINLKVTDNFYYQEFMYFSKPKKRLQPLPKFTPNKKNIVTAPHSKRTISLKPIAKNNHQMIKLQCLKEITELSGRNNKHHKLFLKQPSPPPTRPFDNIILNPTQSKTRKTSTNTILHKKEGLTHHELFQRKESNLNTYFNMRINKLKDITKENKRIYVRLNSQKSLYSSRNLDKSYQDNCNLSRRLSESKMSKASSRCSIALKKSDSRVSMRKKEGNVKKAKEIKVQSHSIKNVGQGEVQRYLQIFCNNSKGNSVSCSKQKIVKQECRTILIQKQNKNTLGKNILQGICEQIKTKTKHKRPVSFARLL